jgi:hypothetical protein
MAGGHALRGAVTAWLSLIVLQTVVTTGSGRVADALSGITDLINRALDPGVPAIPDRRDGAPSAYSGATLNPTPVYHRPPDMPKAPVSPFVIPRNQI